MRRVADSVCVSATVSVNHALSLLPIHHKTTHNISTKKSNTQTYSKQKYLFTFQHYSLFQITLKLTLFSLLRILDPKFQNILFDLYHHHFPPDKIRLKLIYRFVMVKCLLRIQAFHQNGFPYKDKNGKIK